ncbi:MAG TPA: hypothetical protein VMS56_00255 [Thermoanaerobaculia bacterium]|nr:hypothetical protein [Thermoanaerobaculia bacterium]
MKEDRKEPGPGESEGQARGSRVGRAKEFLGEKAASAGESAKKAYGSAREKVSDADLSAMLEQLRAYVRENPGKALLMSVGAGFLLGLLLRRTDDEE